MARQKVSRDAYLRILHATLTHHPGDSAGMAFQHIIPDGLHTYESVLPAWYLPERALSSRLMLWPMRSGGTTSAHVPGGQEMTRRRRRRYTSKATTTDNSEPYVEGA